MATTALIDIARRLDLLEDAQFICVKRPWNEHAECTLAPFGNTFTVPEDVLSRGFEYFLEVSTAREVCEAFGDRQPSVDEVVRLLLYYAEHDAIPNWVYER